MTQTAMLETQAPKAGYAMDDVRANVDPKPQIESDDYRPAGKLEGRAALVTGGDSGIGAAAAIAFAKEGADVALVYYSSDDDAQAVAERIRSLGRRALVFKGDVGDEEFCRRTVGGIVDAWGRLDVLVNNAGEQTPQKSILDITQAQLVRTFQTNIFSMFFLVKAALPHMPRGGAIVNTTSVTAYQGSPQLLDYSATKGAITAFTRSALRERGAGGPRHPRERRGAWPHLDAAEPRVLRRRQRQGAPLRRERADGPPRPAPTSLLPAYVFLACDDPATSRGRSSMNGGTVGERVGAERPPAGRGVGGRTLTGVRKVRLIPLIVKTAESAKRLPPTASGNHGVRRRRCRLPRNTGVTFL